MDKTHEGDVLAALERLLAEASALAVPSTVAIGRRGRGAGVVVASGRVLTNAHNLRDRTTQVTFADGRTEQGRVIATDAAGDLAVLDVDTDVIKPVVWADDAPGIGQIVVAIDRGVRGARVTVGTVSGVSREFRGPGGRTISGAVEHTAAMGRGSSGGPLLDRDGRLAGINTHRSGDGFYLARPVSPELRARVEALVAGTSHEPVRLGVAIAPGHVARRLRSAVGLVERDGALVRGVGEGGPAARAGIREGDLIVSAGGKPVAGPSELHEALDAVTGDAELELGVVRGESELVVVVTFDAPPTPGEADGSGDGGERQAEPET